MAKIMEKVKAFPHFCIDRVSEFIHVIQEDWDM
jgi:hypothetical protein